MEKARVRSAVCWLWRPAVAALTGPLLVLALPPTGWWPLGWVATVPLLLACRNQRFLVGFLLAAGTLFIANTLTLSVRLPNTLPGTGDEQWVEMGYVFFGAILGLVAAVYAELRNPSTVVIGALASSAVVLEAIMLRWLPASIALTQSSSPPALMIAGVGGAYLISFLLWFAQLALADRLGRVPTEGWPRGRRTAIASAAVAATVAGGYLWSADYRSQRYASVVLVQSTGENRQALTALSGHDPHSLAIWPELSGTAYAVFGDTAPLRSMSAVPSAPAILTTFRDGFRPQPHNTAAIFYRGSESEAYNKRFLFGGETKMHTPGDRAVAVPWQGIKVGLNVCFDSCNSQFIRETARSIDQGFIAVPSGDPAAPGNWLGAMHAAFSPLRAAENGITIVRDDAGAYSQVADPSGRNLTLLPACETSVKVQVPTDRRWTLYSHIGNVALYLAAFATIWVPASTLYRLRIYRSARGKRRGKP